MIQFKFWILSFSRFLDYLAAASPVKMKYFWKFLNFVSLKELDVRLWKVKENQCHSCKILDCLISLISTLLQEMITKVKRNPGNHFICKNGLHTYVDTKCLNDTFHVHCFIRTSKNTSKLRKYISTHKYQYLRQLSLIGLPAVFLKQIKNYVISAHMK